MKHNKYLSLRLINGIKELWYSKLKLLLFIVYVSLCTLFWNFRYSFFPLSKNFSFYTICSYMYSGLILITFIFITLYLLVILGTPQSFFKITNDLQKTHITNALGERPILLRKYQKEDYTVFQFDNQGISILVFDDYVEELKIALRHAIKRLEYSKNMRSILIYTKPIIQAVPDLVKWENHYLSTKEYLLILGEGVEGKMYWSVNMSSHLLLGGSTNCGKTKMFKCLLLQALLQGHEVFIADFKGVDFCSEWYQKAKIITTRDELVNILNKLLAIMNERKDLLRTLECSNIEEYNQKAPVKLKRIFFAIDEAAEAFQENDFSKIEKEEIKIITSKMSTLARQCRACGIHLILCTQRPTVDIIPSQIKSVIDLRLCGFADSTLSKVILDTIDASQRIGDEQKGRFLSNRNELIQGYLYDELELLKLID